MPCRFPPFSFAICLFNIVHWNNVKLNASSFHISLTHSLTYFHSLTHLLAHSLTLSLTHSLTHSLTRFLTHSLIHSLSHFPSDSCSHLHLTFIHTFIYSFLSFRFISKTCFRKNLKNKISRNTTSYSSFHIYLRNIIIA